MGCLFKCFLAHTMFEVTINLPRAIKTTLHTCGRCGDSFTGKITSPNPSSPLGYRCFKSSFNQNNPSPYPLPGPPIRPPWISRGRTSLSPNNIKHPARASKSATLIGGSFLYVRTFAGRLWGWEKTIEHKLHLFSYLFNYASGRASPGSIENCKILANNPSPRTGPR